MPKVPGNITMEEAHDRKVTHKVISLIGESMWKISYIGTRAECWTWKKRYSYGDCPPRELKILPLSGPDFGLIGIAPLMFEFGEGYYL
jgi:hypothetical protein